MSEAFAGVVAQHMFRRACVVGDCEAVEQLMKAHPAAMLNEPNKNGMTPLHETVASRELVGESVRIIELIATSLPSALVARDADGRLPFHCTARASSATTALILARRMPTEAFFSLDCNGVPSISSSHRQLKSAWKGSSALLELVEFLPAEALYHHHGRDSWALSLFPGGGRCALAALEKMPPGLDVLRHRSDTGETLLHCAIVSKDLELVEALLPRCSRAVLASQNTRGLTPLMLAALHQRDNMLLLLLKKATHDELMLIDTLGRTALFFASGASFYAIMEVLDDSDIATASAVGTTALILSTENHCFDRLRPYEETKTFLERVSYESIAVQFLKGRTPLHLACEAGQIETATLLCEFMPPEAFLTTNTKGQTCVHVLARLEEDDAVALLQVILGTFPRHGLAIRDKKGATAADLAESALVKSMITLQPKSAVE